MSAAVSRLGRWTSLSFLTHATYKAAVGPRLRPGASRFWRHWRRRRELTRARGLIPTILAAIPRQWGTPSPSAWRVHRTEWTESNVAVITLGPNMGPPTVVLKLPGTPESAESLRRQNAVLRELHAHPSLGDWRALLPIPLLEGEISGQPYVVEQALPGREMDSILFDPTARTRAYSAAIAAIQQLHQRTARSVTVDGLILDRWVDQPLRLILGAARRDQAVERLALELHEALAGQSLSVGWIHGDYWPRNLLVGPDGVSLTGILDWDLAAPDELPMHDVLNLLLSWPQLVQGRDLGDVVRTRLEGAGWTRYERTLLEAVKPPMSQDTVWERVMLLLYWLRFVATYLAKSPERARDPWWMAKNVEGVLHAKPAVGRD